MAAAKLVMVDYIVIVVMLLISSGIGVYYWLTGGRQKSTEVKKKKKKIVLSHKRVCIFYTGVLRSEQIYERHTGGNWLDGFILVGGQSTWGQFGNLRLRFSVHGDKHFLRHCHRVRRLLLLARLLQAQRHQRFRSEYIPEENHFHAYFT